LGGILQLQTVFVRSGIRYSYFFGSEAFRCHEENAKGNLQGEFLL